MIKASALCLPRWLSRITFSIFSHQVAQLMNMLKVVHADKLRKRNETMHERVSKHHKVVAKAEAKRDARHKVLKKAVHREMGKKAKKGGKR